MQSNARLLQNLKSLVIACKAVQSKSGTLTGDSFLSFLWKSDVIVAFGGWCRIVLGEDQPFLEITPEVIKAYGSALQYGHKHIYQAMPRMLTVWFEYGNYNVQTKHKSNKVWHQNDGLQTL